MDGWMDGWFLSFILDSSAIILHYPLFNYLYCSAVLRCSKFFKVSVVALHNGVKSRQVDKYKIERQTYSTTKWIIGFWILDSGFVSLRAVWSHSVHNIHHPRHPAHTSQLRSVSDFFNFNFNRGLLHSQQLQNGYCIDVKCQTSNTTKPNRSHSLTHSHSLTLTHSLTVTHNHSLTHSQSLTHGGVD